MYRDKLALIFSLLKFLEKHPKATKTNIRYAVSASGSFYNEMYKSLISAKLIDERLYDIRSEHPDWGFNPTRRLIVTITDRGRRLLFLLEELIKNYLPNSFMRYHDDPYLYSPHTEIKSGPTPKDNWKTYDQILKEVNEKMNNNNNSSSRFVEKKFYKDSE